MISILFGAFTWFRSTWLGKALAIAGGVLLAVLLIYRRGKADQRQKQERANLEEYIDARKRAEKAVEAARDVGSLDDDELDDRLRKRPGAFRD